MDRFRSMLNGRCAVLVAVGLAAWSSTRFTPSAQAQADEPGAVVLPAGAIPVGAGFGSSAGNGPLAPALAPEAGVPGFGLGFHLGNGFGGRGVGTGPAGGYPLYAGPGYPHPAPRLNRFCGINPFVFEAGPGYPTDSFPNAYAMPGGLAIEKPVVAVEINPLDPVDPAPFGSFAGAVPYPESQFAPFTTSMGTTGNIGPGEPDRGPVTLPPTPDTSPDPSLPDLDPNTGAAADRLGIDTQVVQTAARSTELRIARVRRGSLAARAGLAPGEQIVSTNGYRIQRASDLDWVVDNAAPDRRLEIQVRARRDARVRQVTTKLP